jgi:hypothetical protein
VQILLKHYSEAFALASNANLTESVGSLSGRVTSRWCYAIQQKIGLQRIITDLNQSSGMNFDFYLALIINMLNTDESLSRFLTDQLFPRELEGHPSAWLKWMSMIFNSVASFRSSS